MDEAGGSFLGALGIGGLVDCGDEGVEFILDVGVCKCPVVVGGGGVEDVGEDEFVEDLLACEFGEVGKEVGGGDGVRIDDGDDGGSLWGGVCGEGWGWGGAASE